MDVEFAYYNLTLQELVFDMGEGSIRGSPERHRRCSMLAVRGGEGLTRSAGPSSCKQSLCVVPQQAGMLPAGKEIHWIEWGVGGGASQDGMTPVRTALEAAYWPYWGIYRYSPERDPWTNPEVQAYLLHYINATSAYLLQV